ncbi:MAG: DUF4012 domain-containing protein [bacterium]|nr:DUF4012 domain-containing protein [bacterium]
MNISKKSAVITLAAMTLFYFFINLSLGFYSLNKSKKGIENSDYNEFKNNIFLAKDSFHRFNLIFHISKPIFFLFENNQFIIKGKNIFFLAEDLSSAGASGVGALNEVNIISRKLINGEDFESEKYTKNIQTKLSSANKKISQVEKDLESFDGKERWVGKYLTEIKENLPRLQSSLSQADSLVSITPRLLGSEGTRRYLLLFQNNMELRPTGGFIGSYGILIFTKGKPIKIEIKDVYSADGQLRGHVDPPKIIKEYLGQAGWYLRDSNWDPDFPTSAERAEWFLNKETGEEVDGVVGLNLFAARKVLSVIGEIEIIDYEENINSKNFFEKTQIHNEVGFFPGSTSKKDFLQAVWTAISERLRKAPESDLVGLLAAMNQSLDEKDIQIWVHDKEVMAIVGQYGWDGGIKTLTCLTSNCLNDYLMANEANVGINKANYFLDRQIEMVTKIHPSGQVEKNLSFFYENKSPSELFPGGKYVGYLRLYLPEGSKMQTCFISDVPCLIEKTNEHQKDVFGFTVRVPIGEKVKAEINWLLPGTFDGGNYRFYWQKQSGTKNDPVKISFYYPGRWQYVDKKEGPLTLKPPLIYNNFLSSDIALDMEFNP